MADHAHDRRVQDLFARVLEAPPEARKALLDAASGDDAALRAEVDELLGHHAAAEAFLARPALLDALPAGAAPPGEHPARLGGYAIEGVLGEGGMGVVYLARQESPRRQVALKVLRPGTIAPRALRRFEQEAQMLGRLQHPGIAQIHEAGTADTGSGPQPFFALEYVRGPSILEHADAAGLGARERLALLAEVCDAIQHAHDKGVIHRDLKPGNVLVDTSSGRAQPKVLDFGVARATDSDVQTATLLTGVGQLVGTVPYMSPEQAAGDRDRIDARSDVYALGVIAYELLTGRLPYELTGKALHEAVRTIREDEPTPLSAVNAVLRGDAETLVLKALEKDPARRYSSAAAFAEDIRRWIRDEPIRARPASALYQLGKFARRNRALVAGITGVFVALVLGLVGTGWQARIAARERDRATDGWQAEEEARIAAYAALDRANRVSEWFQELLGRAAPGASGPDVRLADVLDRAVAELPGALKGVPDVEADVRATVGRTYARLGRLAEAERELRAALELCERAGAAAVTRAEDVRGYLGQILERRDRPAEAEPLLTAALEHFSRGPGANPERRAEIAGALGLVMKRQDRLEEAAVLLEGALERLLRNRGARSPEVVTMQVTYGNVLSTLGRLAEAERIEGEALAAARDVAGPLDPLTLTALNNLACTLQRRGELERALPLFREAHDLGLRVQGESHPDSLARANNLAGVLGNLGQNEEARALYERLIPLLHEQLGPRHVNTLMAEGNLALQLSRLKLHAQAEALHREVLDHMRETLGPTDSRTIAELFNLSWSVGQQLRFDEALDLNLEAVRLADESLGADTWERWFYRRVLGSLLEAMQRCDEAVPHLELAADNLRRLLGAEHRVAKDAADTLARCRLRLGR